ncbi:MAG: hypothetical protein WD023_02555, partial [Ilumatobacteraceae bacterium]
MSTTEDLPTWSVADVHESFEARSFVDNMERTASDVARLEALFDDRGIRAVAPRPPLQRDADDCAAVVDAYNDTAQRLGTLRAYVYATVATDTRHERAQALLSELEVQGARVTPLLARFADWVEALGVDALAELHP